MTERQMVVLGFTGRADGMSEPQRVGVRVILEEFISFYPNRQPVGLHGDALGADKDFYDICEELGIPSWCRPCSGANRAHTGSKVVAEVTTPMVRNRAIVAESHLLIATPPTPEFIKHSGSWATLKYMVKAAKPVFLVKPDGESDKL